MDSAEDLARLSDQWNSIVRKAVDSLTTSDGDRFRLSRYHTRLGQIVEEIEEAARGGLLTPFQANEMTDSISKIRRDLSYQIESATDSTVNVTFQPLTESLPAHRGGRPRKHINTEYLSQATNQLHFGPTAIARQLNNQVHPRTVRRRLLEAGLRTRNERTIRYTNISTADLDATLIRLRQHQPLAGAVYMEGALRSMDIILPRDRIRQRMSVLKPADSILRRTHFPERNVYRVAGPMSVWHHDGQHELIDFGIVVHGFIDGFSRVITGLRASSNNDAATVLTLFLDAVDEYGVPSRVRGDRGGENVQVAIWITGFRGGGRGSYLWGVSPHNTRIERLWVDTVRLGLKEWYDFFMLLQRVADYNRSLDRHKWLGIFLFLDDINQDLAFFRAQHNNHRVRTERNRSPAQIFFEGVLANGGRGLWIQQGAAAYESEDAVDEDVYADGEFAQGDQLQQRGPRQRSGRVEDEVNGHVALDDPRCPFRNEEIGVSELRRLMEGQWYADKKSRWLAGLEVMEALLEQGY